jgi:hypothetical protein
MMLTGAEETGLLLTGELTGLVETGLTGVARGV